MKTKKDMRKFTKEQIEAFSKVVNDGIIEYLNKEKSQIINKLLEKIFQIVDTSQIIEEYSANGELSELIIDSMYFINEKNTMSKHSYDIMYKLMPDIRKEINRSNMIKLLNLQPYATKDEIINELKEIL